MNRPSIRGERKPFSCPPDSTVRYRVKKSTTFVGDEKKGTPSSRGTPSRQRLVCAPQHNVSPLQRRQATNERERTVSLAVSSSSNTCYSFIEREPRITGPYEALDYDFTQVRRRSKGDVCHDEVPRVSFYPPRRGVSCVIMLLHLQSGLASRKNVDTASKLRRSSLR